MTDYPHTIDTAAGERLIVVAVGRLLGWHRRFAGAPEPISR